MRMRESESALGALLAARRAHAHCCDAGTCGIKTRRPPRPPSLTARPPSSKAVSELGSGPQPEPVASVQRGGGGREFKLFEGSTDKTLLVFDVTLETPKLQAPPPACVPHADPF